MKRKRTLSVEAEIRQRAQQLLRDQEVEAYKTAALLVCSRKLDEIRALLQAAGFTPLQATPAGMADNAINPARVSAPAAPVHPCQECGREAVVRTKPNKFNRTGSWLCRIHLALKRQYEQTNKPTQVELEAEPLPSPPKQDTGGDVGIGDAMAAAFGVDGGGEPVQ